MAIGKTTTAQIVSVHKLIGPGEVIHWVGRPHSSAQFWGCGLPVFVVFVVVLSIVGAAILLPDFFAPATERRTEQTVFAINWMGVPVFILAAIFWYAWKFEKQVFALTEERALIISGTDVRTVYYNHIDQISVRQQSKGLGDVVFYQDVRKDKNGHPYRKDVGFFGIKDASTVAREMRRLRERFINAEALRYRRANPDSGAD